MVVKIFLIFSQEKYYAKSVKELPKLVEFYKLLNLRYKYRIDKKKAEEITIGEFLKDLSKEKGNRGLHYFILKNEILHSPWISISFHSPRSKNYREIEK